MIKQRRSIITALVMCLIFILWSVPAFADAGDGTGGGDGENKDVALTLVSSTVADNATDVALNETIQLTFNKNICNITILPNNKKCFHLTDENGEAVAIKLTFPDNQVQREFRHQVFIQPKENLEPDSTYRISVDKTLTAKNGTFIDNAHTITFTTGNSVTDVENSILKELGDFVVTYETAYGETADSVPVDVSGLDDVSEDNGPDTGSIAKIAVIVLVIIVIIFTAAVVILKRRKE